MRPSRKRFFRGAKGDYVGGDSCLWHLWPVLRGGRAVTLFIVAVVRIDNREIHEKNERQRRGLKISDWLISDYLVFVYFVSFVGEKLQRVTALAGLFRVLITFSLGQRGRPAGSTVATSPGLRPGLPLLACRELCAKFVDGLGV